MLGDGAYSYTWDGNWGNPSAIDTVSLTYDALGRMVEQNRGGTYTQVVYSPSGAKLAQMNGQSLQKAFVPLPGGGTAVYTGTGLAYYRHPDWLGSSRLATTPSQTVYAYTGYAPFGENYEGQGSTDLSFTGQNQDTVSGLFDFLYREYSPAQGRWTRPDPKGLGAVDLASPQTWNRYAYVSSSPLASVDPDGLDPNPWNTLVAMLRLGPLAAPAQLAMSAEAQAAMSVPSQPGYDFMSGVPDNCMACSWISSLWGGIKGGIASGWHWLTGGETGHVTAEDNGIFTPVTQDPDPLITLAADVGGIVGTVSNSTPVGVLSVALSVKNDPRPQNITTNLLGLIPGLGWPVGITGAYNDTFDYIIHNSTPGPTTVGGDFDSPGELYQSLPAQEGGCAALGLPPC